MRNSKITKITLVGLLITTSIGMVNTILAFNFAIEDALPIYEGIDFGPTIRSTMYPIIGSL